MGVEKSSGSPPMLDVDGHDFVAAASPELEHVDVVTPRNLRNAEQAASASASDAAGGGGVGDKRVGRRVRREESEFGGY